MVIYIFTNLDCLPCQLRYQLQPPRHLHSQECIPKQRARMSNRHDMDLEHPRSNLSRPKKTLRPRFEVRQWQSHPDKFRSHDLRINNENFRMQNHNPQALKSPVQSPAPAKASEQGDQSELLHQALGLGLVMMALLPKLFALGMSLLLLLEKGLLIGC